MRLRTWAVQERREEVGVEGKGRGARSVGPGGGDACRTEPGAAVLQPCVTFLGGGKAAALLPRLLTWIQGLQAAALQASDLCRTKRKKKKKKGGGGRNCLSDTKGLSKASC